MQVVVAEKPSVARDIASVLGATQRAHGYLHGCGYAVTWALGHLVTLPQPHEVDPEWKRWTASTLPMLPKHWPLVVVERTRDQFEVVQRLLNSADATEIVCATDAGREGELIFRLILEKARCRKPFKRLWISSLTPAAIRSGFASLRDGSDYDALAAAAAGRSRADWLVGMNLSRAYTLRMDDQLSVGRVQTPTLAMLVQRDREIGAFVPEHYLELWVRCLGRATDAESGNEDDAPQDAWFQARHMPHGAENPKKRKTAPKPTRFEPDGEAAELVLRRVRGSRLAVVHLEVQDKRQRPPLLHDLTELQRQGNRLFGFSAQHTLQLAQELYEKHKLISYPRTDCRHLSAEVHAQLPGVIAAIAAPYRSRLPDGIGQKPLGKRFVDDARITDHHAIIPTQTSCLLSQGSDAQRIYDLFCRRLLCAYLPDYRWTAAWE